MAWRKGSKVGPISIFSVCCRCQRLRMMRETRRRWAVGRGRKARGRGDRRRWMHPPLLSCLGCERVTLQRSANGYDVRYMRWTCPLSLKDRIDYHMWCRSLRDMYPSHQVQGPAQRRLRHQDLGTPGIDIQQMVENACNPPAQGPLQGMSVPASTQTAYHFLALWASKLHWTR